MTSKKDSNSILKGFKKSSKYNSTKSNRNLSYDVTKRKFDNRKGPEFKVQPSDVRS